MTKVIREIIDYYDHHSEENRIAVWSMIRISYRS